MYNSAFVEDSPPDLSLSTPSPPSSTQLTSEGASSDPEQQQSNPGQHKPAFQPEHIMGSSISHTISPHALLAFQQQQTSAHDPPSDSNHINSTWDFDEMVRLDSIDPTAIENQAGTIQHAPSEPDSQVDSASVTGTADMFQTSSSPAEQKPQAAQGSPTTSQPFMPLESTQHNLAQFGLGSHYSHTSDADLGYTATSIVRPPRDQLGPIQVHVHGVALVGAKSRVETQIRMRIELVRNTPASQRGGLDPHAGEEPAPDLGVTSPQALNTARARFGPSELWQRIGSFSHIKLPPGTGTRRKGRKYKPPSVNPQHTLFLDATVVNATAPHNRINVCDGCVTRERKRFLRMKGRGKRKDSAGDSAPLDEEEALTAEEMHALGVDPTQPNAEEMAQQVRHQRAKARVVVFNTDDYVEFHNGEAVLPTRITCYCRHHKEKLGFCIIFTLRDWTGQLLATGTTPPIMITDDHKTSQTPQGQAQIQAQADALATALSSAHEKNAANLRSQGITPPPPSFPNFVPTNAPPVAHAFDMEVDDTTPPAMGRTPTQQRRKSSATARIKPYARRESNMSPHPPPAGRANRALSRVSNEGSSPVLMEGLNDYDRRSSITSQATAKSQGTYQPPSSNSLFPPDTGSPLSTVPEGPMPLSAFQTGLSPDTLQPMPMDDQSHQLPPGMPVNPDPAMLMQAYMFARSQTGEPPPFFPDPTQPGAQPDWMSLMQGFAQGQWSHSSESSSAFAATPTPNGFDNNIFLPGQPQTTTEADRSHAVPAPRAPPAPRVSQLIPNEGPTTGGTEVTVLGENFAAGITVLFGDTPAVSTNVWASNTLVCVLPPSATPGPVIVGLRLPNPLPEQREPDAPLTFFTYIEQADRGLMELALQVVGLKMTGQVHSARDVAMRVMGNGDQSQSSSSTGGGSASDGRIVGHATNPPLDMQDNILALLTVMDEDVPELSTQAPVGPWSSAQLSRERRSDAVRLTNRAGQTLLHLSAQLGFDRLVDDLLRRGAPINAPDCSGFTALHFAALCGRTSIVHHLLLGFADPRAQTRSGATPLQLAKGETAELLYEHFDLLAELSEWDEWDASESESSWSASDSEAEADISAGDESIAELRHVPQPLAQITHPTSESHYTSEQQVHPTTVDTDVKSIPKNEKKATDQVFDKLPSSDEKALLAASLAAASEATSDKKNRKFVLPGGLQKLFSPNVWHSISAPLSVYRVDRMNRPNLSEEQLAGPTSKGKAIDVGANETDVIPPPPPPPPAYEAVAKGSRTEVEARRRRRTNKKDVSAAPHTPSTSTVVATRASKAWRDDRMLVLFWLPALIIASLLFLYSATGSVQHFVQTLRQGRLFKLDA